MDFSADCAEKFPLRVVNVLLLARRETRYAGEKLEKNFKKNSIEY